MEDGEHTTAQTADASGTHRVPLAAGWSLWRWVLVRSAGFPGALVDSLAAPDASAAADRLLDAEDLADAARRDAIADLEAHLERCSGDDRRPVTRLLRRLRKGTLPESTDPALAGALDAVRERDDSLRSAREQLEAALTGEAPRLSRALQAIARDPLFREALVWQNRAALRHGADPVARGEGGHGHKQRKREQLVASYLQRYCVKNDSIGFFGPFGWGRIRPGSDALRVRLGTQLVSRRTVYFEHWAVRAVADRLAEEPDLRLHLAPRRLPSLRIEGTVLWHPIERRSELPAEFAAVLAACDGERTARAIAGELTARGDLDLEAEEEVYEILHELSQRKLVVWTLEIPTALERPADELVARLEAAGATGAAARERFGRLDRARHRIAEAAGDAAAVDAAMTQLDQQFEELADTRATRRPGQIYAGRTPVFEDCVRDLELDIGQAYLQRFAAPLSLVLLSARWYTHEVAARYRAILESAYDELADEIGPRVSYLRLWDRVARHFPSDEPAEPLAQVQAELERRWAAILELDPEARTAARDASHLQDRVRSEFAAPGPGWPGARYHSPDLLIAARGAGAVALGQGLAVLGELHLATNTLSLARREHPEPGWLAEARRSDLPEPGVFPVIAAEISSRADHVWLTPHDVDLETGATRSWRPRSQVMAVGELVVTRDRGRPVVGDGRHSFDLIAFFEHYIMSCVPGGLRLLPALAHTPRVVIDDLVIAREAWRFGADELEFARLPPGADRFAAARRFQRDRGLPGRAFVKFPEEPKPIYVDFSSPIYIGILARLARRASRVDISEMLPDLDDLWLPDPDGRTYTCELRIAAVDPQPWQPPGGES